MFFHVICFWNFLQICTLHKLQTTVQCSYFTLRIDLSVGNIFIPSYLLTCSHILLLLLLPDQFNFVLVVPLSYSWALTSSFDKKKEFRQNVNWYDKDLDTYTSDSWVGCLSKEISTIMVFLTQQTWLTRVVSIGERERLLFAKNISAAGVEEFILGWRQRSNCFQR